ncbi:hypothetical protein [Microcoleus sp. FACHB-1515]
MRSSIGNSPLARSSNPRITRQDLQNAQRLRVSSNRRTVVSGDVGPTDRNDLFRFFVSERSQFLLTIRRGNRNINTTILNQRGRTSIAQITTSGPREDTIFNSNLSRGVYYVRVFSRLGRTNYRLTVSVRPNNIGGNIGDDGGVGGGGTDPTPTEATQLFRNINPGSADSDPTDLTVNGNALYFAANNGLNGDELFRINQGSNTTQQIIINRTPGEDSAPRDFVSLNNSLFFSASDGVTTGRQLFRIANNANTATRVSSINLTGDGANPTGLTVFNNLVFFAADGVDGRELYRSDGTTQGTFRVADINPGIDDSNPTDFAVVGNRLYFAADNGLNGRELYSTDGTQNGTRLEADINTGGTGINADSSIPTDLVNLNNVLYFAATGDGTIGRQLWRFDPAVGLNSLREPVSEILNGAAGASPGTDFTPLTADDPASINTFLADRTNRRSAIVAVGNELYFAATSSLLRRQLYRSDGTTEGTEIAASLSIGGNSLDPTNLTNINGVLYFAGTSQLFGTELYRFNPATAQPNSQPELISNINPGSDDSDPSDFVLFGNNVVFAATSPTFGRELRIFTPTT